MSVSPRDLLARAELGLPYDSKQLFRRAMMHLPWRMFIGRQVEFNRASAQALADLTKAVRRLDRRLTKLEDLTESIAVQHRDSAAIAVREQLYETEGVLRRDLSALQIALARLSGTSTEPAQPTQP